MLIVEDTKCCGCRTCLQVCTQGAISVVDDIYGFERIVIDNDKCVGCGKCRKDCPIIKQNKCDSHISCGSAYAKDESIKKSGSSGGLFGLFARKMISCGGVVYGAAFDSNLVLRTTRAVTEKDLERLYKSKYILCDTSDSFAQIRTDLDNNVNVLYCASPCQLSGLKNYLGKQYDNLLCIEFVCHGVGGQAQFRKSIDYIEKKEKVRITDFSFREKPDRAASHYYYRFFSENPIDGERKNKTDIYMTFPYYYAYCDRLTCRDACYSCPFASKERVGDITIGDFHSINKYQAEIDKFSGVSMYICNTEKGNAFFESIKDDLVEKEYNLDVILSNNRFSGEETPPPKRETYLNLLANEPYERVVKELFSYKKDWRYYYYFMPRWIRKIGNSVFGKG